MKLIHALLLNVVVVAAGLFVYDRWIACEDPLGANALARLEKQMAALDARPKPRAPRDVRRQRLADAVVGMKLGIGPEQEEALLDILQRNFAAREKLLKSPALKGMGDKQFERAYRNVIEPHMNRVRNFLRDPGKAEAVIKRFIYDGRPITKPDPNAQPRPGTIRK